MIKITNKNESGDRYTSSSERNSVQQKAREFVSRLVKKAHHNLVSLSPESAEKVRTEN